MPTQHRPYQGYPYTNPHVTDAPSIDAATARRWADLPRRPLQTRNVIYVDIPEDGGSQVASQTPPPPRNKKNNIDDNPVIYIEVPESSSSDVTEPAEPEAEPEYVRETIFYNPFDNRRIDQEKNQESASGSKAGSDSRPPPPTTLELTSPGSSGYGSSTPGLPASMSKEVSVYQGARDDRFLLSSIPVSEFPRPPPAYTEIEVPVTPAGRPIESTAGSPGSTEAVEPPRTIVITPGSSDQPADAISPIGLPDPHRKVVYCHHCGLRVHTLVIKQTGAATHLVAITFLCIGLFPMTILVYLTDTCKNKNHYCPNCNKLIGYEVPILCKDMTYTK